MAAQVRGPRLYIFQASPVDAGEYVCRASNGLEASITVTVTSTQGANFVYREWGTRLGLDGGVEVGVALENWMTVTFYPVAPGGTQPIRIESSSSHVAEGQTLDLNCVVPGQAHSQVTWHKRGGSLPARHQVWGRKMEDPRRMGDPQVVGRAEGSSEKREALDPTGWCTEQG
jgi:dystroglycan 1